MKSSKTVQRIFLPGDQWLYFKFYIGKRTADEFIKNLLSAISDHLLNESKISKWFYIRYTDTEYHIRYRVYKQEGLDIEYIIKYINRIIYNEVLLGVLWKVQIDSYERELTRYGAINYVSTETIFYESSKLCCALLNKLEDDKEILVASMLYVEELLKKLNYSEQEQLNFININSQRFRQEFSYNYGLSKKIKGKYNSVSKIIDQTLSMNSNMTSEIRYLYGKHFEELVGTFDRIEYVNLRRDSFWASIIHMHTNRLFRDNQRYFEFLIYEFLRIHKLEI